MISSGGSGLVASAGIASVLCAWTPWGESEEGKSLRDREWN